MILARLSWYSGSARSFILCKSSISLSRSATLYVETEGGTTVVTGGIIGLETAGSAADRRIMSFGCKLELPLRYGTGIASPFFKRRNLVG